MRCAPPSDRITGLKYYYSGTEFALSCHRLTTRCWLIQTAGLWKLKSNLVVQIKAIFFFWCKGTFTAFLITIVFQKGRFETFSRAARKSHSAPETVYIMYNFS